MLTGVQSRDIIPYLFHQLRSATDAPWVTALSGTPIPSDQASETYGGLTSVYPLSKWEGPRKVQELKGITYTIANQKFQAALRVLGEDLRREKTMQVDMRIQDLRRRWAQHWNRLLSQVIKEGETALCYDGQAFFDTDHQEGDSGQQSNDITSSASAPTTPTPTEAETAVWAMVTKLMELKDDTGEPVNDDADAFTLLVPPSLLKAFAGALNAENLVEGNGTRSNILIAYGGFTFDLRANSYLATALGAAAWTTKVAMFVNNGRALIRQNEVDLQISSKAEGSEFEHDHDMHEYGVMTSRAVGYGRWQDAILCTLT